MIQPVARIETVTDVYFGNTSADPYRWMENWEDNDAKEWLASQANYTRMLLDAIPARATLLERVIQLGAASVELSNFQIVGKQFFYLRRDPGEEMSKLVTRVVYDAPEQILFDPNRQKDDIRIAIDWYTPSRDGRLVAYGLSEGGSEESTLYVLDVDSGKTLDLAISRTRFGCVDWLEDNRSFVYLRFPERPTGASLSERFCDSRIYLHHLDNDPELDTAIWGRGVNVGVEIAAREFPFLALSPISDWILGVVYHGVLQEISIYAAPRSALANPATIQWTAIADVEDQVTRFTIYGDTIYLRTHKDAPRYKVIAISVKHPDWANVVVVVPEGQRVIEEIRIAGDYLLTRDLDGGISRIRRTKLSGGEPEDVPLPFEGTITAWATEAQAANPVVLLEMASWIVSPRLYCYNINSGTLQDTGWRPASSVDFSGVEVNEVFAPAKDGILIPLSIIHKRGLALDGNL